MTPKVKTEKKIIINNDLQGLVLIPYRDFGNKFRDELKLHKTFINQLVQKEKEKIIPAIISSGEELALVYSQFKCESCGSEDNLQSHHLIQKNIKPFINSTKYIVQRFYWSNICILCNKCHARFHGFNEKKFVDSSICISKDKIYKVKKLYKMDTLELNNEVVK